MRHPGILPVGPTFCRRARCLGGGFGHRRARRRWSRCRTRSWRSSWRIRRRRPRRVSPRGSRHWRLRRIRSRGGEGRLGGSLRSRGGCADLLKVEFLTVGRWNRVELSVQMLVHAPGRREMRALVGVLSIEVRHRAELAIGNEIVRTVGLLQSVPDVSLTEEFLGRATVRVWSDGPRAAELLPVCAVAMRDDPIEMPVAHRSRIDVPPWVGH